MHQVAGVISSYAGTTGPSTFYSFDQLGNVRVFSGSTGSETQTNNYYAFGAESPTLISVGSLGYKAAP